MTKIRMMTATLALFAVAATANAEQTLRFGTDNNPDVFDNPQHACAGVFSNIMGSATNGEINVEIFGNNQLGNASEHVQQVRDGILHATLSSTGAMASYYPRIDVLNMPFAFANNAATYHVFDGAFGQALAADIEETLSDVVVLGFPDTGGFFAITNSKQEIASLDDMKGVRIRTMTLPSHQVIIPALGAEAYPLAWGEVYSGLQTGVIDGQMNPIPIISFSNFNEVQQYMTLTNHLFSPYTFLVNRAMYEGLTPAQQATMRLAAEECVAASRGLARIIEASDRGLAGLMQSMTVTALNDGTRQEFVDAAQPAFEQHIANNLDAKATELLNLMKSELGAANSQLYMQD